MAGKWEYVLVDQRDFADDVSALQARLNELGDAEWEIVAYAGYGNFDSIILKRGKRGDRL